MSGLELDSGEAITLAVEVWRVEQWLNKQSSDAALAAPRYAMRRINAILDAHGIETLDFTGSPASDGLAVDITEAIEDAALEPGERIISETLQPVVLRNGEVVQHGRVVVRFRPESQS